MNIFKNKIEKNKCNPPFHIAIIMDGNGRWAKKRGLPRTIGHKYGAKRIKDILEGCRDFGVKELSLYTFSLENWKRDQEEVESIFKLVGEFFHDHHEEIKKNKVKVSIIGEINYLVEEVRGPLIKIQEETCENRDFFLNIVFNYGGQQELVRAARLIAEKCLENPTLVNLINEDYFKKHLYSKDLSPIDLMIRTSGEMRISNYLPWQNAYSEFYFTDVLWPDFDKKELYKAINEFQKRHRRFGGV